MKKNTQNENNETANKTMNKVRQVIGRSRLDGNGRKKKEK